MTKERKDRKGAQKRKKGKRKRGGEKKGERKEIQKKKEKRKRKDTEQDKRKRKEIAIFIENLKTLHKILTVLQFYLGNSNFFFIFHHLNGKFFIFDFVSDFISFKDRFRVTNFSAME